MKKEREKKTGEKKIQISIGLGGKNFDDTEFQDSLNELDNSLKDIDESLKDMGAKFEKI